MTYIMDNYAAASFIRQTYKIIDHLTDYLNKIK